MMKNLQPNIRFSVICLGIIFITSLFTVISNALIRFIGGASLNIPLQIQMFSAIPSSFGYLLLFLLPGILISYQIIKRNLIKRKYYLLISITFSSLTAFTVFWVYYFNNVAGRIV